MSRAVIKAGRGLMRDFSELEYLQVSRKGPKDFVSSADLKAEKIIMEELEKARPGYSFLTEESGNIQGSDNKYKWIIDPIDGTHNYLHGLPYWVISIGLACSGELIAGVIFDPVKNELFHAEKGCGAYLNDKRLRVAQRNSLEDSLIACGQLNNKLLETLISKCLGIRKTGATALNLAYLAAGRFDVFITESEQPWDSAAGSVIIKESGGKLTEINGSVYSLNSQSILAANVELHETMQKLL